MSGKEEDVRLSQSAPLLDGSDEKAPLLSGAAFVVVYIIGSVFSSVAIVMCNKEVFERGFRFPLTLSLCGYVFTWLFYVVLEKSNTLKVKHLPTMENFKVALSSVGSISFMNLCLLTNTVAIYQICKFAVIPCQLVMQKFIFGVDTNWRILLSLTVVLGGVGWATFKGLEMGTLTGQGVAFAVLAVISTSIYRIWQGTKQKEYKIGPTDFQATMAGMQTLVGLLSALIVEFLPVESDRTVIDYMVEVKHQNFQGKFPGTCLWLLGVCVCALTVNFTSFGLIGKTGPIAYAVVGHAKTVLTIILGIVFFPKEEDPTTIRADIVGCGVALLGVIAYGEFEYSLQNKKPDWVERHFPALCPKKSVVTPTA